MSELQRREQHKKSEAYLRVGLTYDECKRINWKPKSTVHRKNLDGLDNKAESNASGIRAQSGSVVDAGVNDMLDSAKKNGGNPNDHKKRKSDTLDPQKKLESKVAAAITHADHISSFCSDEPHTADRVIETIDLQGESSDDSYTGPASNTACPPLTQPGFAIDSPDLFGSDGKSNKYRSKVRQKQLFEYDAFKNS